LRNISQLELNKFNNFDFKLAEANEILKEANRICEETSKLVNDKSEAVDLYNDYMQSGALQKHGAFVEKAHHQAE
jgi:hypothetical protein